MKNQCEYQVQSVGLNELSQRQDKVACEEPLEIWLKQQSTGSVQTRQLITTMRSPGDDINLVRGWLLTSGLIGSLDLIQSICHSGTGRLKGETTNSVLISLKANSELDLTPITRLDYVNSSCGICGQQSIESLLQHIPERESQATYSMQQQTLFALPEQLKQHQMLFSQTGGCHGAALIDQQGLILDVREDVGRHNALDKLIGAQHQTMLSGQYAVLLSGRVSFELVQKAAMAHVPLLIAIGAPSSLAIDLCRECDIGLVGFVKETGFNVYHGQMTGDVYTTSAYLG